MTSTPDKKWKPINKSLLTPCRRPGLSRIVKTPLHVHQNQELIPKTPPAIQAIKESVFVSSPRTNKQAKKLIAPSEEPKINSTSETKENAAALVKITPKCNLKTKKSATRLSMKRSASPEEFDNLDKRISIVDKVETEDECNIGEIRKRIREKENRLEDLKRAAAYAKSNNLCGLEELTNMWKEGCNRALNHLLLKLQEHGPIEMPSLLRKLNIPESVIDCNEI